MGLTVAGKPLTMESDEISTTVGTVDAPQSAAGAVSKPEGESLHSASARVFISYRSRQPDINLAQEFYEGLQAAGHIPFMAGESIRLGENWPQRVDSELEQCDYFLLLLSPQSAISEMVTEEVRRAKQLRDTRPTQKPIILPIRVGFPMDAPLNYDLRGYLQRIQQREWQSEADTPIILQEILSLISGEQTLSPVEPETEATTPAPILIVPDGCPLPVAEPEIPGGQMELASAFYVERPPIEDECFDAITKRAALIRIKAPRQMGKTSLMARILHYAEQEGYRTLSLTFQLTDESVFSDLNQFLRRFCALVSRKLRVPVKKLDEYWDEEFFGPKDNCTAFFEECLLPDIDGPLVLALDEVDQLFPYNTVAKEFLTLLRAWNEQAKVSDLWGKLRLVIVHSTEVYVVMDTNSSPFNIGLPIDLTEFEAEQVADLARRHGLNWGASEIDQLMGMMGGHPYLIRMALYHIARHNITIEELLREAPTEAGLYGDHLRRHLWNLQQYPELRAAIKQVVNSTSPVRLESTQAFKLQGMGLVDFQDNDVVPCYDLYRLYFRDRLKNIEE